MDKAISNPSTRYKDGVFRMLFRSWENFLQLCNALMGTAYGLGTPMRDTTLSDVFYHSWKNDISYLINDETLLLVEHQSTLCGSIAARMNIYQGVISSRLWTGRRELYDRLGMKFPAPKFAVIYNGLEKTPPRWTERFSDRYRAATGNFPFSLDLEVAIYNINSGYDRELAGRCEPLRQYQAFVETVRRHEKKHELGTAIALAIDECIKNDVLAEFLTQNAQEVRSMLFKEFTDTERYEMYKDNWITMGLERGIEEERRRNARAMRSRGYEVADIAEITGLTIDDVLRL